MRCLPLFDSFLQRPGVTVGSPQAPSTSVVRTRANPTLALGVLIGVLYKRGISCVALCAAMPHASICVPCVVFDLAISTGWCAVFYLLVLLSEVCVTC